MTSVLWFLAGAATVLAVRWADDFVSGWIDAAVEHRPPGDHIALSQPAWADVPLQVIGLGVALDTDGQVDSDAYVLAGVDNGPSVEHRGEGSSIGMLVEPVSLAVQDDAKGRHIAMHVNCPAGAGDYHAILTVIYDEPK